MLHFLNFRLLKGILKGWIWTNLFTGAESWNHPVFKDQNRFYYGLQTNTSVYKEFVKQFVNIRVESDDHISYPLLVVDCFEHILRNLGLILFI